MEIEIELKRSPEEFLVTEAMTLPNRDDPDDQYFYYRLLKSGYTTFEAIEILSASLSIPPNAFGYAGLKDEDGVTSQYISINRKLSDSELIELSKKNPMQENKYCRISYWSSGHESIQIGNLLGNKFRIVAYGLDNECAEKLRQNKSLTSFFINYYGPQRFGLPGQEKVTHLLGKALIDHDYANAMTILGRQQSELGEMAKSYTGCAEAFFKTIDPRKQAFFMNSYYSYCWNKTLADTVIAQCQSAYEYTVEKGISYALTNRFTDIIALLQQCPSIAYSKTFATNDGFKLTTSNRTTLIQTTLLCNRIFNDLKKANSWACELSFFLPSGCYATVAIPQLINLCLGKTANEQ